MKWKKRFDSAIRLVWTINSKGKLKGFPFFEGLLCGFKLNHYWLKPVGLN